MRRTGRRSLRSTLIGSALLLAACGIGACGESDSRVDLTAARGCLADSGFRQTQIVDVEGALPGSAAPNLAMERDRIRVEAVVNGDIARARRRLADLRGALASFGAEDPELRVTRVGNAVIVFTPSPSREVRRAAISCFERAESA